MRLNQRWKYCIKVHTEIIGFKDLLHNAHRLFGFSEIKDNEDTFNNLTRLAQDAGVPIGTFWEQEGKGRRVAKKSYHRNKKSNID